MDSQPGLAFAFQLKSSGTSTPSVQLPTTSAGHGSTNQGLCHSRSFMTKLASLISLSRPRSSELWAVLRCYANCGCHFPMFFRCLLWTWPCGTCGILQICLLPSRILWDPMVSEKAIWEMQCEWTDASAEFWLVGSCCECFKSMASFNLYIQLKTLQHQVSSFGLLL